MTVGHKSRHTIVAFIFFIFSFFFLLLCFCFFRHFVSFCLFPLDLYFNLVYINFSLPLWINKWVWPRTPQNVLVLSGDNPVVLHYYNVETLKPTSGYRCNWRASKASETLSGVYKFELVWHIYMYGGIYVRNVGKVRPLHFVYTCQQF